MLGELKPCPFCGGNTLYMGDFDGPLDDGMTVYVRCILCGANIEGEAAHPDQKIRTRTAIEDVTEKWNARAELDGVLEVLDAIYPYAYEVYENCGGDDEQRGRAPRMRKEIKNADAILRRLYWGSENVSES